MAWQVVLYCTDCTVLYSIGYSMFKKSTHQQMLAHQETWCVYYAYPVQFYTRHWTYQNLMTDDKCFIASEMNILYFRYFVLLNEVCSPDYTIWLWLMLSYDEDNAIKWLSNTKLWLMWWIESCTTHYVLYCSIISVKITQCTVLSTV